MKTCLLAGILCIATAGGASAQLLDAPTDGTIKGKVVLEGVAPKMLPIDMAKSPDRKYCESGTEAETHQQTWIIGKDKGVANVVVRLVPPAGKKFKPLEPDTKEVQIDIPHCTYVPHVAALRPGQVLKVKNSSKVVHATNLVGNPGVNLQRVVAIPPGRSHNFVLNPQGEPIQLTCQIHSWMYAVVCVADHPYIAVTDSDGKFEFKNVPAGVVLDVEGLHEAGRVQGGVVRARSGQLVNLDLTIRP